MRFRITFIVSNDKLQIQGVSGISKITNSEIHVRTVKNNSYD